MPPKGKKTKAEEALDFLSNLDSLDVDAPATTDSTTTTAAGPPPPAGVASVQAQLTGSTPRASTDSSRPSRLESSGELVPPASATAAAGDDAAQALEFLEKQINTKRAPLTLPQPAPPISLTSRPATPSNPTLPHIDSDAEPANVPTAAAGGGGWGSSWWSTATTAIQSAQKIADEGYKKVRTEGVSGVTGQLENLGVGARGVDLAKLRKEAEDRLGGIVKGVDLEKLRQDLYTNTTSALTNILNTVAPPISAHETLELWLTHPMIGYGGVEGVVYRAWMQILEQTESGELVTVWSPGPGAEGASKERGLNSVEGWDEGVKRVALEIEGVVAREEKDPKGRKLNGTTPVTTVPIFLHLLPVIAPLCIPQPPLRLDESTTSSASTSSPKHLQFLITLQDPTHNLRFTTTSQPVPGDWLEVEYEQSEWVEERLVDVIRVGVEVLAQDYVATRMALKPSAKTRPPSPKLEPKDGKEESTAETT